MTIRVTIWNEGRHEKTDPDIAAIYPDRIDGAISEGMRNVDFEVRRTTLDDADQGLPDALLNETDVLLWWGHIAHAEVGDALVDRIQTRVLGGMGLVALHSSHHAKPFRRLMGTSCNLSWREHPGGELERVWVVAPSHPIAEGLPPYFEVPRSEMYGEPFDIPAPDELVFCSWFQGGEIFRSGCAYQRGRGRIFYFAPGHETFPIYHDPLVQRVIANATRWAHQPHPDGSALSNLHRPDPLSKI